MLELINLKKTYVTKSGQTIALNGVNIKFADKGLVFITGKSGCGKTTLLNMIGGLDNFDSGDIIVDGKKFSEFTPSDYDSYRNTLVGFVFQEYNLLSEYTIEKNVDIANELQGKKTDSGELKKMLEVVEMSRFANRTPNQLSGGQKQRVAIARALIKSPKIVLADEPTGALDSNTGIQVMELLKKLSKDKLIIVVSHEMEFAEKYADRIIRIVDGQVVEDITLEEIELKESVYDTDSEMVVKSGSDLTADDTKKLVQAIKEKKKINVTEKISVRQRRKTGKISQSEEYQPVEFIKSKMKLKSVMGFGTKSITVKPFRLIITILLSMIAFAVFGLFDSVASYNGQRALNDMLRNSGYSAVSVSSVYNDSHYDNAEFKMTQAQINNLKEETGYNFRGVYEILDTEEFSVSKERTNINRQVMLKDLNFSVTGILGKEYYIRSVSGIIEFSANEIKDNIIAPKEYGYKIVYGKYPELSQETNEIQEIGISSFLAESIMYWTKTKKVKEFGGKIVEETEDLIGAELKTVNSSKTYAISAIIDCGSVPTKFDKLKTISNSSIPAALMYDFTTYINSSGHLLLFAPSGYINTARKESNRKTAYVGNYTKVTYSTIMGDREHFASKHFYNSNEFDGKDTILFNDLSQDKEIGVNPMLNSREVLINANNIKLMFEQELSMAINYAQGQQMLKEINRLSEIIASRKTLPLDRRVAVKDFLNVIEQIQNMINVSVAYEKQIVVKTSSENKAYPDQQFEIVGLYYDVDTDELQGENNLTYNPFVMSEEGLEIMNINKAQGIYSRAIAGLTSNYFGAKTLSKMLIKNVDEGTSISWYKNQLFNIIEGNSQFIGQIARLFLYIAIVVVGFSIFMLFNYISTSIMLKRQTIGILRALGTRSKSIFEMFLIESIFITIISGVLACVSSGIACIFVNNYILQTIEAGIRFALFGARQIFIIMLASVITGVLAALLPIIRITKEKPVALIRKE